MGRKKGGIPGVSFSWKRATGLSSAKQKLSRQIGVPLTKSGRQRKAGRAMGCAFATMILGSTLLGLSVGGVHLVKALFA